MNSKQEELIRAKNGECIKTYVYVNIKKKDLFTIVYVRVSGSWPFTVTAVYYSRSGCGVDHTTHSWHDTDEIAITVIGKDRLLELMNNE